MAEAVRQDGISNRGDTPQVCAVPAARQPSSLQFLDEGRVKCFKDLVVCKGHSSTCVGHRLFISARSEKKPSKI